MDLLDKVLLEWSARTEKGYPDLNNEQDLAIFESMFGFKLNEQEEEDRQEVKNTKTIEDIVKERTNDPVFIERITATFYDLPSHQQNTLLSNYLDKFTVSQFIDKIDDINRALAPFYYLSNKKGSGKGEFIPLLSIKNAKSGGTADKDVVVGNTKIEVKELAKKAFLTAASGTATSSDLSNNLSTFIKYGPSNSLLNQIPDLGENSKAILEYFKDKYRKGNLSDKFRKTIKKFADKVNESKDEILKKAKNLDYVKYKGKRYTYIDLGEGEFKIDSEVSTELADLKKLLKHPYISGEASPEGDLEKLKIAFFDSLDYILLFKEGGKNPTILSAEEAKKVITIQDLNQGNVRLNYNP